MRSYLRCFGSVFQSEVMERSSERLERQKKLDAAVLTSPPPSTVSHFTAGSIVSSISSASSAAISAVCKSALSSLPRWLDKDSVSDAMAKRKKRTPTKPCQDN